jgi:O-antigen/teichoic acid export membrane protein
LIRVPAAARRVGWGLADQVFSSLTNLALSIFVARSVDPESFGAFAIGFATYLLVLGISRALTSEPLTVRFSAASKSDWREASSASTGSALVLGVAGGAVCLAVGALAGGALGQVLVALGVALPGLILQDAWRFAFLSGGSPARAFLNDLLWAVALVAIAPLLIGSGHTSVFWLTLAWGGAATIAAAAGMVQSGIVPRPMQFFAWLRQQRGLAPAYLGEFLALTGSRSVTMYAVGAIAGLVAAGAIRAAQILFGPLNTLFLGLRLVAVPEAVRLVERRSAAHLQRFCRLMAVGMVGITVVSAIVILLLPAGIGRMLLGETWTVAEQVTLPLAFFMMGGAISISAVVGLRALGAARRSLRSRSWASAVQVVGGVGGAAVGGAAPAAWGLAVGVWFAVLIWWMQFRLAVRDHSETAGAASEPGQVGVGPPLLPWTP